MEKKIGLYLKYYREELSMSQEYFSQCIGIGTRQYQRIEMGIVSATIRTLMKIINAVNATFSDFFKKVEIYNILYIS